MTGHDLGLMVAALSLVALTGCPSDPNDEGAAGDTEAAMTSSSGGAPEATGTSTGSASGTSGAGDPSGTSTTTDAGTSTADPASTTGEGASTSTGEESSTTASTGEPETTGPLDPFACDGYFFAACSFCLQTNCLPQLQACEGIEGCCCYSFCIEGGNDPQVCMIECGLQSIPSQADDLLQCKTNDCGGAGQCPQG